MPPAGLNPERLPRLPEELENQFYEIVLEHQGDERRALLDELVARYPDWRESLRARAAMMTEGDRVLGHARHPARGENVPRAFGAYEIIDEIGRGGFGTVYRARQNEPVKRIVALKMLQFGRHSERAIARFSAERQALARMQHPGIAQVFDAGTTPDGQQFLAMELVEGTPITGYCDRHRLDLDARLRLFVEVCDAVTHAHQRSVIHRDLKPSNILVIERDGGPRPVIIDFGLAKAMDEELADTAELTIEGGFVGTPAYASPEQAAGQTVDTRTDVHALGLLLFELLTGDQAHGRDHLAAQPLTEALRIVSCEDPRVPSRVLSLMGAETEDVAANRSTSAQALVRRVRGDLDGIVLHALERDPDRRYPSVATLADDVARFLANLPVTARRPTLVYVVGKLARRHRAAVIVGAVLLLALVVGATAVVWGAIAVGNAQRRTAAAQQRADWNAYAVSIAAAKIALEQGFAREAIERLDATDPELRGWEHDLLRGLADTADTVLSVGDDVYGMHWLSQDLLAVARRDGAIEVWDLEHGEIVNSVRATGQLARGTRGIVRVGDRKHVLVGRRLPGNRLEITLVDLAAGRVVRKLAEGTGNLNAMAVSPDGERFAIIDNHDLQTGPIDGSEPLVRWDDVRLPVRWLAFAPDGESVIAGTLDGFVVRAEMDRKFAEPRLTTEKVDPHNSVVAAGCVDRTRGLLATADLHRIAVWEIATGELRFVVATPTRTAVLEIDEATGTLYAAGGYGSAMVAAWDIETSASLGTFTGHRYGVHALAISPDGARVAAGGVEGKVRIWDTRRRGENLAVPLGLDCRDLDYDPERKRAAYCNLNRQVVVRDLETLDVIMEVTLAGRTAGEHAAFASDRMFVLGGDGVVRALAVPSGEVLQQARLVDDGVRASELEMSPDESLFAAVSWETRTLYVLDPGSLAIRWQATMDPSQRPRMAWFSPDSAEVVVALDDGLLRFFAAATGTLHASVHCGARPSGLAYTPDGRALVVCTANGEVILFERAGLREVRRFSAHNVYAASAAISPDGTRLATGGADGLIRIHDFATGTELVVLKSAEIGGHDLAWSADGRRLFTRTHHWATPSELLVWDAGPMLGAGK